MQYPGEQPALSFEKVHGLSGVAGRYKFPPRMGRAYLNSRIYSFYDEEVLTHKDNVALFEKLEQLNPEQTSKLIFNRNSPIQLDHVVQGIVGGFNVDDINFYIERSYGGISKQRYDKLPAAILREDTAAKIMEHLGPKYPIRWKPSPQTLDHIWEQVKDRPVNAPEKNIFSTGSFAQRAKKRRGGVEIAV